METVDAIDLGDGVILTKSTEEDFAYINSHLRKEDRDEQKVFDPVKQDSIDHFETVYTISDNGNIVGFFGTVLMKGDAPGSCRRFLVELTTDYVWKIPFKYAKMSRKVLAAVVCSTPPWVTDFFTLPMKAYERSVKWIERILTMHRIQEVIVNGVPHVLFHIKRNEVMK